MVAVVQGALLRAAAWRNLSHAATPPRPLTHPPPPSVESWELAKIRRDDYAPNGGGQKMWEFDRKRWLADRLTGIMKVGGRPAAKPLGGGAGRGDCAASAAG